MPKKRLLLILTKKYPYSTGEEFLEGEIPVLAKEIEHLVIIATAVPVDAVQTRELPPNCQAFRINESENKYVKYAKYIISGLSLIRNTEVFNELTSVHNIAAKLAVIYIAGRSANLVKKINNILKENDFLKRYSSITFYSYWFSDLPYVAVLCKKNMPTQCKVSIVSRAHGYDLYDYRNKGGYIPFRSRVLENIDKVFPCSKDGSEYLCDRYPQYSRKIEVSYLGTKDLGVSTKDEHEDFRIVTCSYLIPLKRLDLVAHAVSILKERGFSIDWTCIGNGDLYEHLNGLIKELGIESKVHMLGRLNNNEVLKQYKEKSFDLFVNVSETEGLPVSIMEAISFGIPVLATNVGGTREIVIDGLTGILIEKDTSAMEIAEKIEAISNSKIDRENVRNYWETNFNCAHNYQLFCEKILNVMH